MLESWYTRLQSNFCGRSLTHDFDMLPALYGVAYRIQLEKGSSCYAAIWETDLIRGLLWRTRSISIQGKDKFLARPDTYRAPSWSWVSVHGEIFYGITHNLTRRWRKEKHQCLAKVFEVGTALVGPVFNPMGQVGGRVLKINSLVRNAVVVPRAESDFIKQWTGSKGVIHLRLPVDAWDFLVAAELVDTAKLDAVSALGAFDINHERPEVVFCLLLTLKEGLLLEKANDDSEESRMVGFFQLENKNWFEGCVSKLVTIILIHGSE